MAFKVENKIPLPSNGSKFNRSKYPFGSMAVGDSFLIAKGLSNYAPEVTQVRAASSWYGKRNKKTFSVRRHEGTYRCWRVA